MKYVLTAALIVVSTAAQAAQITFGPSVQQITFAQEGAGLHVTAPQLDAPAFDTTSPVLGGVWILGLDFTTGPEVGGIFPANPSEALIKYMNGSNLLIERISTTFVQDGATQPKVFGIGTTIQIEGDAAFLAAFGPVGTVDRWDFVVNDLGTTLDRLVTSASATISAGEKVPAIPEPSTLGLLGAALAGLGVVSRRRA